MRLSNWIVFFISSLFLWCACSDDVDPYFEVSTTGTVVLAGEADSQGTYSFTSAREWTATTTAGWLSISPASGEAGSVTLTLTADSLNDSGSARSATVTLTSVTLTRTFTVQQESVDLITLEQTEYTVDAGGGELLINFSTYLDSDEFSIWSVSSSWLSQSGNTPTKALGNYYVRLRVQQNTTSTIRTAYLYFVQGSVYDENAVLATVTITQEGVDIAESTDYSANKTYMTLQTASKGSGIPIVLMGDGFMDTSISDGTYDEVMEVAYGHLFSEEPLASLREYFDVYVVYAVSRHDTVANGYETVFGSTYAGGGSTTITGDDDTVKEYAEVTGVDVDEALLVVILNSNEYGGTTAMYMRTNMAVSYCPIIDGLEDDYFRKVLVHEAIGHGLGRLDDEYGYEENGTIPSSEAQSIKTYQSQLKWYLNVDFTTDTAEVLWADFLADSRYDSEGLGIYEGGSTYARGVYRPSEESMMRNMTTGFNAPCRKILYDKILERGAGETKTYEEFVAFDQRTSASTTANAPLRSASALPGGAFKPFGRPRIVQ